MIYAAVMGLGTIGSGVVEILEKNKDVVTDQLGQELEVKYILDLRDFPGTSFEHKVIHDFSIIEKDQDVKVVVETMGGLLPAFPWVKACLQAGKHVVTSNKALVAAHGTELLKIARENQVNFLFEASVGGGIPIIRPLYRCLMGERIEEITGILNGTTNYILTKMDQEGQTFEAVLKEAQELGYAERNPEADIEGHDTCRKLAILTAMATGKEVDYQEIHTEGITDIEAKDFLYARQMAASVKLLGSSQIEGDSVHAWVLPVMIGRNNPLYSVCDVFNGILVRGNMLGETMFYGKGAGKLPTASAVVADMIQAILHMDTNVEMGWGEEKQEIASTASAKFQYFVRLKGEKEELLEKAESVFGPIKAFALDGEELEFAILTETMEEGIFQEKLSDFPFIKFIRARLS
ncbi:homoserine dehydrogenase [Lachnoclostridium edouardi]|uniref:homoserine dehydrogenase n=1 Tax=Lachnoclostridium edouardi TaxID=1926283 RepID=UPI000C7AF4D3|nr:homoserine dehydrogenase [Lachnoclostridium edouardi]